MKFVPRRLEQTADVSRGDTSWQSFAKNALSVVIVLVLGYLALGLVAELVAWTIPDPWEARMFPVARLPHPDSDAFARAEEILARLARQPGLRDLPYRLTLLPDSDPNAFAYLGGGVGVTRGLLDKVDSETGLATVLGHELGHHQHRHPLRQAVRSLVFQVARGILFGLDGDVLGGPAPRPLAELSVEEIPGTVIVRAG